MIEGGRGWKLYSRGWGCDRGGGGGGSSIVEGVDVIEGGGWKLYDRGWGCNM